MSGAGELTMMSDDDKLYTRDFQRPASQPLYASVATSDVMCVLGRVDCMDAGWLMTTTGVVVDTSSFILR